MKQPTKQLLIGYFVSMFVAIVAISVMIGLFLAISKTNHPELAIAVPVIVVFLVIIPAMIVISDR